MRPSTSSTGMRPSTSVGSLRLTPSQMSLHTYGYNGFAGEKTTVSSLWKDKKMMRSSSSATGFMPMTSTNSFSNNLNSSQRRGRPMAPPGTPSFQQLPASSSQKFDQITAWLARQDSNKALMIASRPTLSRPSTVGEGMMRMPQAAAPPTPPQFAAPVVPQRDLAAERQKLRSTQFVKGASEALNSRFSDMFKAFQYVDLDRSGTLNKAELTRAIEMWNLPVDESKLDDLIAACDADGDGNVDYKEFVDVLARDTVAPAAMGKRDMQAMQAMGAADVDPAFLGHAGKVKHAYAKAA